MSDLPGIVSEMTVQLVAFEMHFCRRIATSSVSVHAAFFLNNAGSKCRFHRSRSWMVVLGDGIIDATTVHLCPYVSTSRFNVSSSSGVKAPFLTFGGNDLLLFVVLFFFVVAVVVIA
jgi:hypothetical protein